MLWTWCLNYNSDQLQLKTVKGKVTDSSCFYHAIHQMCWVFSSHYDKGHSHLKQHQCACTDTCTHACTHTCIHTYTKTPTQLHTPIPICTHMNVHTHAHALTHTHACSYTHVHMYTHTQERGRSIFLFFISGVDVSVDRCSVTLGQVPGQNFPFSDHEGVAAEFRISRCASGKWSPCVSSSVVGQNFLPCPTLFAPTPTPPHPTLPFDRAQGLW